MKDLPRATELETESLDFHVGEFVPRLPLCVEGSVPTRNGRALEPLRAFRAYWGSSPAPGQRCISLRPPGVTEKDG